ncbi:MAG: thioredoxin domain-containing protein [Myxococcaceae bacterium]
MNRLRQESSPYLRQHADNPVDWYPWGDEALERARRDDKPILLSVGYSACHWCHVMAHESFEDPETAKVMNNHFVNIKVDREERPDLDQIYQGVVQLTGRGGGWPLTVVLTPDLRPFFGGTYFPPQARHGLASFQTVLHALADAWRNRRDEVEQQAVAFKEGLVEISRYGLETKSTAPDADSLVSAARSLAAEIDPRYGGFGRAPKFPNPMNVAMLFRGWRRSGEGSLREATLLTLERMAQGGIYDQLGGGFHRYSVDERWLIPHFEKMLYDNGQLLHLYADAQQVHPRPLWERIVRETAGYLAREMTSPEGAFYASQDADSEGEEGRFFVWTPQEIEQVLGPESAALFRNHYAVPDGGNFEHGRSVLEVVRETDDAPTRARLDEARQKLLARRALRVWPGRDDKVLAGWNGLAISGLAHAASVFGRAEWATQAARAADFVWKTLWDGSQLKRVYQDGHAKIDAFLEDYGQLAAGFCKLYQASFDERWLRAALALVDTAQTLFFDEAEGAYRTAALSQKDLVVASFALHDNAVPSGAACLTEAQLFLGAVTGRRDLLDRAEAYVHRRMGDMKRNPFAYGHLWQVADTLLDGTPHLVVVGEVGPRNALVSTARASFVPTLAVTSVGGGVPMSPLLRSTLEGKTAPAGEAAAFLCRNFTCDAPSTTPSELLSQLERQGLGPKGSIPHRGPGAGQSAG